MFRSSDPQGSFFETSALLPADKLERLRSTWVWPFRTLAMPLVDEELFRDLYHEATGRPNKPVKMVVGVLILKEMFDLTDMEALWRLEFDLGWQVALDLKPEDAHCCQKTLHNFRAKLMESGRARVLFRETTAKIVEALGLETGRQRLDSTHIVSNIRILTRLGLFCETLRVFLGEIEKCFPAEFEQVPVTLRRRYVKENGSAASYGDAPSSEARRRVGVCARNLWRLVDRFAGHEGIVALDSYKLLQRLLSEQCEVDRDGGVPEEGDADAGDPIAPVKLKPMKEVSSGSLQTPHDPDVTYSGHKGKGYEVQVCETFGNGDKPEIITHVELTPSSGSDANATVPVVDALREQGMLPGELVADTTYGSAENVVECAARGTELLTPVPGPKARPRSEGELNEAYFDIDPQGLRPTRCPAGGEAIEDIRGDDGQLSAIFAGEICALCPLKDTCPTRVRRDGNHVLSTTAKRLFTEQRRRYQATAEFKQRYAPRAGIEGSNSELKRKHGMGRLAVRRHLRVELSVYLKITACNFKRMVNFIAAQSLPAPQPG